MPPSSARPVVALIVFVTFRCVGAIGGTDTSENSIGAGTWQRHDESRQTVHHQEAVHNAEVNQFMEVLQTRDGEGEGGCKCWPGFECHCSGREVDSVPNNLSSPLVRLTLSDTSIVVVKSDSLDNYRNSLAEFTMLNNKLLESLEPGLFDGMEQLSTIYILHAPALKSIHKQLLNVSLPKLKVLRIFHSGLTSVPHLNNLRTLTHLNMLDLENNQIPIIRTGEITLAADQLVLNYNRISTIEPGAFNGSMIDTLSFRGNKELTTLYAGSFGGMKSLRRLDLSETSISYLPTEGLQQVEVLKVQNVPTLKVFPSIYNFQNIRKVELTYAYHCCAFRFPAMHDPDRHIKHQKFISLVKERCSRGEGYEVEEWTGGKSKRSDPHSHYEQGTFHPVGVTVEPGSGVGLGQAWCGNLSKDYGEVDCKPAPDAFNPCEDLMGNWWLRISAWAVALLALIGNGAVLLVLLSSSYRMTVPKFLMCNLATADLCMGLYLLLIVLVDAKSIGVYFNHAIDWQSGPGCAVAGFLTVFSSELSILTLTVITSERWYTITYAIHMNKRLKLATALKIMSLGWLYAIVMAALPLLGVSGYYKTSICLPLENSKTADIAYLGTLLTFNALAFWLICACYARMYWSIRRGGGAGCGGGSGSGGGGSGGGPPRGTAQTSDATVAKRMALLVFTDFACWAPIAFFGLTALAGHPLIDVTNTKILLVFFYPLNSCANPYLYALLTHQYRRDVLILLSRYGLCAERAARYKGTLGGGARRGGGCKDGQGAGGGPGGGHLDGFGTGGGQCGVGVGGSGQGGGTSSSHRGSLLTTLTSFDCATRQASLTAVHEPQPQQLQLDTLALPNQLCQQLAEAGHDNNITSTL